MLFRWALKTLYGKVLSSSLIALKFSSWGHTTDSHSVNSHTHLESHLIFDDFHLSQKIWRMTQMKTRARGVHHHLSLRFVLLVPWVANTTQDLGLVTTALHSHLLHTGRHTGKLLVLSSTQEYLPSASIL